MNKQVALTAWRVAHIWSDPTLRDGRSRRTRCSFFIQSNPPVKVYLVISMDEGNSYLVSLMFENPTIAKVIFDRLVTRIKKRISTIATIDLSVDQ